MIKRREELIEKANARRRLLEDSYRYQQFDRDADEVEGWIREKLKQTSDESYRVGCTFISGLEFYLGDGKAISICAKGTFLAKS